MYTQKPITPDPRFLRAVWECRQEPGALEPWHMRVSVPRMHILLS